MRGLVLTAFKEVSAKVRMSPETSLKYFERKILTEEVLKALHEARRRERLLLNTPDEIVEWVDRRWRTDASAHKRLIAKYKSSLDIPATTLSLDLEHMLLNQRHWARLLEKHV